MSSFKGQTVYNSKQRFSQKAARPVNVHATAMTVGSLCQLNLFDNQRIIIKKKKGTTSHTVKHGFIMSQRERVKESMSTKVKCLFLR